MSNNISFSTISPFIAAVIKDFVAYTRKNNLAPEEAYDRFFPEYEAEWNNNGAKFAKEYLRDIGLFSLFENIRNGDGGK
jgi:hypothetical protein